jgi:hypothetical protein
MKLDAGQRTKPMPCPIQRSPTSTAIKPRINKVTFITPRRWTSYPAPAMDGEKSRGSEFNLGPLEVCAVSTSLSARRA